MPVDGTAFRLLTSHGRRAEYSSGDTLEASGDRGGIDVMARRVIHEIVFGVIDPGINQNGRSQNIDRDDATAA